MDFYYLSTDAKVRENNKFPTEEQAIKLGLEAALALKYPIKVWFRHNEATSLHAICLPDGKVKEPAEIEEALDFVEAMLLEAANELTDVALASELDGIVQATRMGDIVKDDTKTMWQNFGDVNYKNQGGIFIKKNGLLKPGQNKISWDVVEVYPVDTDEDKWAVRKATIHADQIWNEGDPVLGLTEDGQIVANYVDYQPTKDLSWLLTGWIPYFGDDQGYTKYKSEKEVNALYEYMGFKDYDKNKSIKEATIEGHLK